MKDPGFDIAFSIGGFNIYWYAILLAVGIAAAMMITDRRTKGRSVPKDIALDLCILGVPFGVLGARLFGCLSGAVAWSDFFDLSRKGMSLFGGVILAALAILVYLKLRKVDVSEMLDIAAPGAFAGIGIAVWGDFFNRSHYGPLVENPAHKWFPLATFGEDLKIHYAAFFYEFLLCVLLIVAYCVVLRKVIHSGSDRFLLMVLAYCLGRFCIDSIRQDMVMVGSMAFDQICEIFLFVVCLFLLLIKRRKKTAETGDAAQPDTASEEEKEASIPADETEALEDKPGKTSEPEKEGESFNGLN